MISRRPTASPCCIEDGASPCPIEDKARRCSADFSPTASTSSAPHRPFSSSSPSPTSSSSSPKKFGASPFVLAEDDASLVKVIGKSFIFSASEAKREEEVKAAHDEAMFGAPAASSEIVSSGSLCSFIGCEIGVAVSEMSLGFELVSDDDLNKTFVLPRVLIDSTNAEYFYGDLN